MAETSLGLSGLATTVLRGALAGFAFGETLLASVATAPAADGPLLSAAALATQRVGAVGVGVVSACLAFTLALVSLGAGVLLASVVMRLSTGWLAGGRGGAWLHDTVAGVSIAVGAIATGTLAGYVPPWACVAAQLVMVALVYSYGDVNHMTAVLLVIFTTLYASVLYGRLGILAGLFAVGVTLALLFVLQKAVAAKVAHFAPEVTKDSVRLVTSLRMYAVVVATLGFLIGRGGAGGDGEGEAEAALMLGSVLWVGVLSAGVLGAALGTTAAVGLGPESAGRVALGAAVTSSAALRLILPACSLLGEPGGMGGVLGAATAAGVSLGATSVAITAEFRARHGTLLVLCPVAVGAVVASRGLGLTTALLTATELTTVTLVAVGAFVLGAPRSPFHTRVNLRGRGLLTGAKLMEGIGKEAVTGAAAPCGAGALGAAALGTAALGRLGTVGVVVALVVALVKILCGMVGKPPASPTPPSSSSSSSPPTPPTGHEHRD